jgi:hypothetical protein
MINELKELDLESGHSFAESCLEEFFEHVITPIQVEVVLL